ncbi:MAG: PepSY domain-containing protein [Gammaproteobacteria bacterium]|nr:PepSY domain-containing protein [Gammaproteobacteria bacterium]
MKSKISSLCLMLGTLIVSLHVVAADNTEFSERLDTRVKANSLQDTGVNNLGSQAPRISRRQALNLASGRYDGRVLGVVQVENNNWRVRMDRDGTVFNVFVNSSSGAVSAPSE